MSLDWHTFKSALGRNISVTYIDEEDSEIPIDSECEFQEALRLARLSKQPLKMIVNDKLQPGQKQYLNVDLPVENPAGKIACVKMNAVSSNSSAKESCLCNEDGPPEWFTHYMKKFKKELFHELKSYIHDSIHSKIEKEKKFLATKSDICDLASGKSDSLFHVSTQIKKKKKSEKDSGDAFEQREAKLQRKLEKLHSTKSERLEKLDNKMRILFEEKRRLSERKRHSRPKLDKTSVGMSEKKNQKKSVFFRENNVFLFLSPGSEFVLKVDVINDGRLPWSDPRLECFDVSGLYPKEARVSLPRLNPLESSSVTLRGKASRSAGLHHLKCRVVDGLEPLVPEFTCWARVEMFETAERPASPKESDRTGGEASGSLIDFEKEIIESSQKKIEENIMEIQRRLHDIDLLRPSTCGESKSNGKRVNGKGGRGKTGCDLLQGLEAKEKSWKERLEEEKVLFGVDCLAPPADGECSLKTPEEKESEKSDSFEKIQNDAESEHSCDSDISMIFMSEEEDENFIMVPSKNLSPAESVNEVSESPKAMACNEQSEMTEVQKPDAKKETKLPKEEVPTATTNPLESCHLIHGRSLSPFGEEIFKPKKIKSKSTEYHFTAENLTQPTFTQFPDGIFEGRPSRSAENSTRSTQPPEGILERRFSRRAENSTQSTQPPEGVFEGRPSRRPSRRPSTFKFTAGTEETSQKDGSEKREDRRKKKVPKTDALGRVIYAVNSSGCCLPMEDVLLQEQTPPRGGKRTKNDAGVRRENSAGLFYPRGQEKESVRFNEIPAVSILPNALMNGASNVASLAFNTARNVFNNLQSAFVTDGKTEMRPHDFGASMYRLYDMGFLDFQLNQELLQRHSNNLMAVVEELVQMQEQNKNNRPQ